jgi:methylated-DNA-[protein]-cysteine S-methyltransferase
MIRVLKHMSPVGPLYLHSNGQTLVGLYFEGHKPAPKSAGAANAVADAAQDGARRQLDAYFAGKRKSFDCDFTLAGTAFQARVWAALLRVSYGETLSYGALAALVDAPRGVRAVAAAVARNPISIFVPCHRIVGADGALTGYAGGVETKRRLLALEAQR